MFTPTGVLAAGATAVPAFTDISDLSAEIQAAVSALASHGITVGTSATTFGPNDNVTREQMAMFLSRYADIAKTSAGAAIASTKTTGSYNYSDIGSTSFEGMESIIRLYNLGATGESCLANGNTANVTGGCASTYRPADDITRAEMATMLVGVLNHTNARPAGISIQQSNLVTAAGQSVTVQVSVRNADGSAQVNTSIDEFYQNHNDTPGVAAQSPFTAILNTCSSAVTGTGGTKCTVDANDVVTDVRGNAALTAQTPQAYNTAKWWAWIGDTGEQYVDGTTDNVVTVEKGWGAASALENATEVTISSDAGYALISDFSGMAGMTGNQGINTFAGNSRTITATLTTATATASATPGYALTVLTATSTTTALGESVTYSASEHEITGKTASWTVSCPADDSALTQTYKVGIQQTISFGRALGTVQEKTGVPTGATDLIDEDGQANSWDGAWGTGVGGHGDVVSIACDDTAPVYTEATNGESMSISTNNVVSSTAGSLMAVTATAYDQYGAGIAGVETEISSSTDTDATNGAVTLRARLLTGAGGTATLSAIVCAGTVDRVEWSVEDADNDGGAKTNEMDEITPHTVPSSLTDGTTVFCVADATDGAWAGVQAEAQVHTWTIVGADIAGADTGSIIITIGGFDPVTLTCTAQAVCDTAAIKAAIEGITGVTAMTSVTPSGNGLIITSTFAANVGQVGTGTMTITPHATFADGETGITEASDVMTNLGVDGTTLFLVSDHGTHIVAEKKVTGDFGTDGASAVQTSYHKFLTDDTDNYNLGVDAEIALGVMGATKAQWDTELATLTFAGNGGAFDIPLMISYRTGATTTGISAFQVGT